MDKTNATYETTDAQRKKNCEEAALDRLVRKLLCVCVEWEGGRDSFYSHLLDISYLPSVFGRNISSPYMSLNLDKSILLHVVVS